MGYALRGRRSPIYDEMRQGFFAYYAKTYRKDSEQCLRSLPGNSGHTNGRFEPKVARQLFEELVAKERGIEVLRGHCVDTVNREGRRIEMVVFTEMDGSARREARARSFVDASYEGDLLAAAGCAYRVGRESREEFGERFAGICFDSMEDEPADEKQRRAGELFRTMNLRQFPKFCVVGETEVRGQATTACRPATGGSMPPMCPAIKYCLPSPMATIRNICANWNRCG